jgi:hypothetical protein
VEIPSSGGSKTAGRPEKASHENESGEKVTPPGVDRIDILDASRKNLGPGKCISDSGNISRSSNGTFTLGFTGGYAITSRFVLGVEVNGWTLKSYNLEDPSQGESISNVSIGINYFPFVLPLFIDAGVGQASYTNNSPNVSGRDKGVSWFLGSGFELPINEKLVFVPQLRYSQGNFTGVDFTVVEVTLGIRWYSGKDE